MVKYFIFLFVAVGMTLFADIYTTRQILAGFSEDDQAVLECFDRVSSQWVEHEKKFPEQWELRKLLSAVEFAAQKHLGQYRKNLGRTPYIIHPIGVTDLLWDQGGIRSVNVLIAALLHDTLEDTDATEEEIEQLFGKRVLYTVREVTNDPNLSSRENKQRQVDHAPSMSLDGQLVKLADRLYNIRDLQTPPPAWSQEKINEYHEWGKKLLHALRGANEGLEDDLQALLDLHATAP